MFYCQEERPKVKAKHPTDSIGDIAKKLGASWKKLTEDQKLPFEKQAQKDRDRYSKEMEDFKKGIKPKKIIAEEDEEEEEEEEDSDE